MAEEDCVDVEVAIEGWQAEEAIEFYKKALGATLISIEYESKVEEDKGREGKKEEGKQGGEGIEQCKGEEGKAWILLEYVMYVLEAIHYSRQIHFSCNCNNPHQFTLFGVLPSAYFEASIDKAVSAGASAVGKISVHGSRRTGKVKDPYGHIWIFNSRVHRKEE